MGGTKRMSAEEKRKTMLSIYHKTKQVYTEKEISALAAKAGINANTVVDINNSLVDDGLVDKEKIGGSNFFWSFPGKKDRQMQIKHEQTIANIESIKKRIMEANVKLADAQRGREEGENNERAQKLQKLDKLSKQKLNAEKELETLKQNDPQALADLYHELKLCKEAANRWTDNIFSCQDYLVKKRGMMKKEAQKFIGITQAFDYPEDKIIK